MPTRQEPCGWVPDFTGCSSGPCCPNIDEQTPEAIAAKALASKLASNILWALTGRRFGCCEIEVRPCQLGSCCETTLADIIYSDSNLASRNSNNLGVLSFVPTLVSGRVFNLGCGVCGMECCTCCPACHVILPGPVCDITEVVVNGRPLGKNQYRVYNHRELAFTTTGETVVIPTTTVPLIAPVSQVTAFTLTPASSLHGGSVELTDLGSTYQFTVGPLFSGHEDLQFVLEIPIGNFLTDISIFQPQGFDVIVLEGGDPTVTRVSNSNFTVGPATIPNTAVRVLIRAPQAAVNVDNITIVQNDVGPGAIRLAEVSWTDPNAGPGGCPTNRTITGPVAEPTEVNVEGVTPAMTACFDMAPTAFVGVDNGANCFSQLGGELSLTMPAVQTYQGGINKNDDVASATHVFIIGGAPLSWSPGPLTIGVPVTSATNSAGYYAVLTPTLGSGLMTGTGPQAAFDDTALQYRIEYFRTQVSGSNCQDYSKENGEENTWSVVYTIGEPVPAELLWAAGQFACEIAKAILGDKSCTLPSRVQTVARQGVDIAFFDPTEFANAGLTGIPLVDLIIRELNPYRMAQSSYVWSPDLPKYRRET